MFAAPYLGKFIRATLTAAVAMAGLTFLPGAASARDGLSFSFGVSDWGASSFSVGYRTGGHWGHRGWNRGSWGHRGWGRDHISLGFTYVIPPAYYGPRFYDAPTYFDAAPYAYPFRPSYRSGYAPAGGVVVFRPGLRDRLNARMRERYYDAYRSALAAPIGEAINWHDGRVSGDVTTTRDGWAGERYCREFRQNIVIDGRTEEAYGTACRNEADTDWEIIPD